MKSSDESSGARAMTGTPPAQQGGAAAVLSGGSRTLGILAAVPALVFLVAMIFPVAWGWIGIPHLPVYFADTTAILSAGQADAAGFDVYVANPYDPLGRVHVYGPWWLVTGRLGLGASDAAWVGPSLGIVFLIAAAAMLRPRDWRSFGVGALALASPPVLMALERGNNDLVVFLLLVAAAVLLSGRAAWRLAFGIVVLVTTAALKLYPIAALPAALVGRSRRRALAALAAAIGALELIVAWQWPAYDRVLRLAPEPLTIMGYGARIVTTTWATLDGLHPWLAAGAAAALGLFGPPLFRRPATLWDALPRQGAPTIAFIATALCWIGCFVAGTSYAYRLVLLVAPISLWLGQWSHATERRALRWQIAGWLAALWLMVPKRWLAEFALKRSEAVFLPALGLLVGFEQTLVVLLTLALAVAVVGWFVREIRHAG